MNHTHITYTHIHAYTQSTPHGVWVGPYLVALRHGGGLQLQGRVRLGCTDTNRRQPFSILSYRLMHTDPYPGNMHHISACTSIYNIPIMICLYVCITGPSVRDSPAWAMRARRSFCASLHRRRRGRGKGRPPGICTFDSPGRSTRGKVLPLPTTDTRRGDEATNQRDPGITAGLISRTLGMTSRFTRGGSCNPLKCLPMCIVSAPYASSVSRSAHTAGSGSLPFLGVAPLAGAFDLRLSPGFPT